jgi:hypothetical protein
LLFHTTQMQQDTKIRFHTIRYPKYNVIYGLSLIAATTPILLRRQPLVGVVVAVYTLTTASSTFGISISHYIIIMFRTNLLRACNRLHVGVKSTMRTSRYGTILAPPPTTTSRHFATSAMKPSTAGEAGGSSLIPSGILRGWYNM